MSEADQEQPAQNTSAAGHQERLTGYIIVVALVSAVSGLLYGYDTGIISGALLKIGKEFDIGDGWKQVIAASILVGAVIGALSCSRLAERRGRRGTMLLVGIVFVVGALAASLSPNPVTLSLSRLVLGFAVGGATQTAPVYVAELSPAAYRGRLVLFFQIAIGAGIVIATIVGAAKIIDWRVAIGMAGQAVAAGRQRHRDGGGPCIDHVSADAPAPGEPALARPRGRCRRRPRRSAAGAATWQRRVR